MNAFKGSFIIEKHSINGVNVTDLKLPNLLGMNVKQWIS